MWSELKKIHKQKEMSPQTNSIFPQTNTMPQQSNSIFPQTNTMPAQFNFSAPQLMSTYSIIPQSLNSIHLSSNNPFLSLIPSVQVSEEEAKVDGEILNHKEAMLNQEKKLQHIRLNLQNETNILNTMKDQLKALDKKKSFVSKKRRVLDQNKQHQVNDEYIDNLDEFKNQRPEGTCQYITWRNTRCWKPAEEKHSDSRNYCLKCLSKILLEDRNIKRQPW